jgi:hypothetical protein
VENRKRFSIPAGVAVAALIVVTLCDPVAAAGGDFFQHQQWVITGAILGARVADFNGDSLPDIVLITSEPSGKRSLQCFLQREGGRFPPSPGQIIPLSSSADGIDAYDVDGDRKAELLIIDRDGVWEYRFESDRFSDKSQSLISLPTLFAAGIEDGVLSQSCIMTISGQPTAFVPVAGGLSAWRRDQGAFRAAGVLSFSHLFSMDERPVKLFSSHGAENTFTMSMPGIVIADYNRDGRDDVYLLWADRLTIFLQSADGRFDGAGPVVYRFQDRSEDNLCQARLVDYDRDGLLDVVSSRSEGGISGAQTTISFFNGTQIARGDRTDKHRITISDACGNLMIGDFDKDSGMELVVPAIELGIMSTVKKIITKKTDFYVLIYPIDNAGVPAKEPAVRKKLTCRLDLDRANPTINVRMNWSSDFDGDGRCDLVLADGGGQLLFYPGSAAGYFEDEANLMLELLNPAEIIPAELNNDGRPDLVIIHRPTGGTARVTLLVTSRIS